MATLTIRVRITKHSMGAPAFVADAIAQSLDTHAGELIAGSTAQIIDNRGQTVGNWSVTK